MLPFLSGRGWGKVLKRNHRQSRGIIRWLATVAFVLLLAVWISSIRFTLCYFASTFASDPTETQYWSYVRSGRVYFGENKGLGKGINIKASIFKQVPSVAWSFSTIKSPTFRAIIVPLWAPTLLAGVTAAWCWRRDRQRRRLASAGSCPSCGYSRAGLSADAKCPECGVQ